MLHILLIPTILGSYYDEVFVPTPETFLGGEYTHPNCMIVTCPSALNKQMQTTRLIYVDKITGPSNTSTLTYMLACWLCLYKYEIPSLNTLVTSSCRAVHSFQTRSEFEHCLPCFLFVFVMFQQCEEHKGEGLTADQPAKTCDFRIHVSRLLPSEQNPAGDAHCGTKLAKIVIQVAHIESYTQSKPYV